MEECKNPRHKEHIAKFFKKYKLQKGSIIPGYVNTVNPDDWALELELKNISKNTTPCCQVCSISEGIGQAEKGIGVTGMEACPLR
jgi:hypothetical protein